MANTLPVSRYIQVPVAITALAAQSQSLNNLLVLGTSDVIDVVTRLRQYGTLAEVATDFGTTAPEYLTAQAWFGQSPQPTNLAIGRWAKTATKGLLVGGAVSAANQVLSVWTAITTGSFTVTIDGGAASNVTGCDFSGATSLTGVAAVITGKLTGATCTWDATYERFQIESATTGPTSTVSFLTAEGTGADISVMLAMRSTSSGAYVADGIAAETALSAVSTVFDVDFSQLWYGLVIPEITVDADHVAVAGYIEGSNTKHFYGVTSSEAGIITTGDTSSVAYLLKAQKYKKTCVQYSSKSDYAVASLLARILTTDYAAVDSCITLMYKQEPGIAAESLNTNQADAAVAVNANFVANVENGTSILQNGVCCSGDWIDTIIYADAFAVNIMTALYNLLYTTTTKVPQTDAGTHLLVTTVYAVCVQFATNGFLGPGQWNSNGFGTLSYGDFLETGFYVYGPPITTQSQADRAARKSVPIQVAAKTAGAVHDVVVDVEINQ